MNNTEWFEVSKVYKNKPRRRAAYDIAIQLVNRKVRTGVYYESLEIIISQSVMYTMNWRTGMRADVFMKIDENNNTEIKIRLDKNAYYKLSPAAGKKDENKIKTSQLRLSIPDELAKKFKSFKKRTPCTIKYADEEIDELIFYVPKIAKELSGVELNRELEKYSAGARHAS